MKRRRSTSDRLAVAGLATTAAAATTIAHRTAMLARATDAAALANPEFVRMGTEKVAAVAAAGAATALAAPLFGFSVLEYGWRMLQSTQAALAEAALCRNAAELAAVQRRWAGSMSAAGLALGESAARVAAAGLRPVHRTAAANAKRLARRRR
jgi:hypothetical protein